MTRDRRKRAGKPAAPADPTGGLDDALSASRERGRRDAHARITRFPDGPARTRAASTLVVTLLQQLNERSPEDDLSRAYVAGVIEVAERELGRALAVPPPPPPSSGSPDAGPTEGKP